MRPGQTGLSSNSPSSKGCARLANALEKTPRGFAASTPFSTAALIFASGSSAKVHLLPGATGSYLKLTLRDNVGYGRSGERNGRGRERRRKKDALATFGPISCRSIYAHFRLVSWNCFHYYPPENVVEDQRRSDCQTMSRKISLRVE